jgi:hypothetical protein
VSLNKYFEDVNEFANENFFSFDGDFEFADEDFGFDDDYDSFDYESDGYSADGGQPNAAPTSQPYIVNVRNTTAATNINNVTILGAYTFIGTTAPAYGNTAGISISMGIANVTYTEFLYQSMNKPFMVGLTYFQSATANQVLETITIIMKDVNGNESQKVLVPTIDPYQQQSTIIALKFAYRVDGFTSLVISSVLASATAKIYFYPSETASPSRALAGRKPVANYGNPNIVKGDVLKLAPSTARALAGGRPRPRGRR